ncbi:uncharacterized protein METZ01_LOCUS462524, partial [marine metagenome]
RNGGKLKGHWDVGSNVNFGPEAPASWTVRMFSQSWVFATMTLEALVAHEGCSPVSGNPDPSLSQHRQLGRQEATRIEAQYSRVRST